MKLKVSKEALLEGLQKVQSIVGPKTTLPILSNVLFKADKNQLWMTTTDLEISVRTSVDAEVVKPGTTTLPVKRFFSICKELSDHDIEIDVDEKSIATVQSGSSFFKLVGISQEDFPPLPKFDGQRKYSLDQGVFKDMLVKTGYAASADETRYILNGVLLSFKGERLVVVATDGRRLALVEQEVEFPEGSEGDLILPSKTVNELTRSLGESGPMSIQASNNQVAFEFGNMLILSKLIEGTYPNYQQVIPAQCEERVTVEREALLTSVRRVALVTNDQTNSVRLNFLKNRLEITTVTPDVGEARETIPIKYTGKDISIAFNPEFVISPLRILSGDEVFVELSDDLSPGVFKSNVPFVYVLMPMRLT